jgi:radical SAM superfamily enzyme YgiQ (UPF0313 family)
MNKRIYQLRVSNPPFGLRFIKENIKGVDILEYPTWDEFLTALKRGYDIVGISFFTWTLPEAVKMADAARQSGAAEVWAGNYGVMTPGVDTYFDKVFPGNCEADLKKEIEGVDLHGIAHPPIIGRAKWSLLGENIGYLYTKRGCDSRCTFCPTPWFTSEDNFYDITGVDNVLDRYRQLNASPVIIYDETFMDDEERSRIIIDKLAERNLRWVCLTRADRIVGRVSQLKKKGLHSAIIGVESLHDKNLKFVAKKENIQLIKEVIKELNAHQCFPDGTYMLGFPDDTAESIRADIDTLATWDFFLIQFTILTPYPGTPLWQQLGDKVIDSDWSHYDSYHLVWDHPHISPSRMRELLYYALKRINRPANYLRKIMGYYIKSRIFPDHNRKSYVKPKRRWNLNE